MTHFQSCVSAWINAESTMLECGHQGVLALDEEGKTIRDISKAICGDYHLEDKLGRYIAAARWDSLVLRHPIYKVLYEDMRDWLTISHYAELWKFYGDDPDLAFDLFEQCFFRDDTEIIKSKSVKWLQSQHKTGGERSYLERVQSYYSRLDYDLITTPLDGLNSKAQFDAAADVRENAARLKESIEHLLSLIEQEQIQE